MNLVVIFVICVLASIFLSALLKTNPGFMAFIFAVLLGILGFGMSVSKVIGLWPSKLMMTLVFMTYFFGFAINNGTMKGIVLRVAYWGRKSPAMICVFLYAVNYLLSAIGVPAYALFAFMSGIVFPICVNCGIDFVIGAIIVIGAPIAGGFTQVGQFGITTMNTLSVHGYSYEQSLEIVKNMAINGTIMHLIVFAAFYFILKGWKATPNLDEPEPLNKEQTINLVLICLSFGTMVLISLLRALFPTSTLVKTIGKFNDVLFIVPFLILAACKLNIGSPTEAAKRVPLDAIITVSGISTLISVGLEGGLQNALTDWAAKNMAGGIAPYILVVAAGIMSFFVSTTNGVIPTLGTLVAGIVQGTSMHTCFLYSTICIPAGFTGFSPFSSGGSIVLGSITDEETFNKLYKVLLIFPALTIAINLVAVAIGLYVKGPF